MEIQLKVQCGQRPRGHSMQPTQDFNAQNLLWMRGKRMSAGAKKSLPKNQSEWKTLAKSAEEEIAHGSFKFRGIYSATAAGKRVLSTNNTVDTLVLRKINDNIRRAYGIRQTQRSQALKLAKQALSEWTPKGIVRIDLKSCFESITPRKIIEKLKADGRASYQTINLLEIFFKQSKVFGSNHYGKGLPRGVLISSTLAELYLKELDEGIGLSEGLYVYIRYVDDIVAVASKPASVIYSEMETSAASLALKLNHAKTKLKYSGCKCGFLCNHDTGNCPCSNSCTCDDKKGNFDSFDYLGYKLIFKTGKDISKGSESFALLSDKKSRRVKTRIVLAINSYKQIPDYGLLLDRIKFLTSNVLIAKNSHGGKLYSGIAFSHEQYKSPPDPLQYASSTLESLDRFLRSRLRTACNHLGVSKPKTEELISNSFVFGFSNRHKVAFTAPRLKAIRSCWENAN